MWITKNTFFSGNPALVYKGSLGNEKNLFA